MNDNTGRKTWLISAQRLTIDPASILDVQQQVRFYFLNIDYSLV